MLAERYDDGGYTGANLERPALRRLLADMAADKIDCVLVYKVDRLSRSLLDFARLMEIFERREVSLVSITQPLNTTGSLGRLTLNILLSFAEFERSMIADRTRDKMAAARRKGKWVGGTPVLGYDVAASGGKLVINPEEARRVQEIFAFYLQHPSLDEVLDEMEVRHWTTKGWKTRDGKERQGRPFTKAVLQRLLRNVLYLGQVSYGGEVYAGEQEAIVPSPAPCHPTSTAPPPRRLRPGLATGPVLPTFSGSFGRGNSPKGVKRRRKNAEEEDRSGPGQ